MFLRRVDKLVVLRLLGAEQLRLNAVISLRFRQDGLGTKKGDERPRTALL